jgi:hypothetical protein
MFKFHHHHFNVLVSTYLYRSPSQIPFLSSPLRHLSSQPITEFLSLVATITIAAATTTTMTNDLINCWACTASAVVIVTMRVVGRSLSRQILDVGDYLAILAGIFLVASATMIHFVIIWGTNNIPDQLRSAILPTLTPLDIKHRVIGSKLVLVARVMYICRGVSMGERLDRTGITSADS